MKRSLAFALVLAIFASAAAPGTAAAGFVLPAPIPGESQTIPIVGSTVIVKGLTDIKNRAFINGREIPVQNDGTFYQEIIIPLGEQLVTVEVEDPATGARNSYSKTIVAKENHFFLAGIADGTVNFVEASENYNLRRDNADFDDGTHLNGKVSYYMVGKIKGKYLIKSALDTDKATQEKLFTNIDPDKYYPVYGDDSTVVYDVHSQGKFYLLVEWDKSGFVLGNYQTQIGDEDAKLSTYNRTLYGAKVHLETPQRTVYGDEVSKATGFIAEANQRRGHSELLGTGGSLYYMRHRNIVEGSEQVRLDVRDKRTGITIRSIPQKENVDYEIKYDEGRILFRKPVLSSSLSDTVITDSVLEGNDVYVVATYEYSNQEAFPVLSEDLDTRTGGGRVSHHLNDHVRVGATYAQEENEDARNHTMTGFDTTVKLGNFTKVSAEFAETRADTANSFVSYNGGYEYTEVTTDNDTKGTAFRTELNSSIGELLGKDREFLEVSAYWRQIDRNFTPTEQLYEAGSEKYGAEIAHRFTPSDRLRLIYENSVVDKESGETNRVVENELEAIRVQNYIAQWQHDWQKFSFFTEYRFQDEKNSLSQFDRGQGSDGSIVAEKIEYRWTERTQFFVGQQIGLDESGDSLTSAGVTHKLDDTWSVFGRGAVGQDSNSVQAGVDRQVDERTSEYSSIMIGENAIDGKSSTTTFGTNTRISQTGELRREKQFVTSDERGVYTSNLTGYRNEIRPGLDFDGTYERREEQLDSMLKGSTPREAASGTLRYVKPDHYKGSTKLEYRVDTADDWQIFSDSQVEWKLHRDLTTFLEYEYSQGHDEERGIATSRIDKRQIAFAYRPTDFDFVNFLVKYIRLQDDRPRDITSADGGFFKQKSDYDEFAGEIAIDLPCKFQLVEKIAYRDESLVAVDVNNIIETPQTLEAYLIIHRLNYHVTNKIDAAAELRTLRLDGSDVNTLEYGPLIEFTYQVHSNIALGAGYNFTSFKDDFTTLNKRKAEGFFVRVQGKY